LVAVAVRIEIVHYVAVAAVVACSLQEQDILRWIPVVVVTRWQQARWQQVWWLQLALVVVKRPKVHCKALLGSAMHSWEW